MRLWVSSMIDRVRASLFVVPLLGVLLAIGGAATTLAVDRSLGTRRADLSLGLTSTVESARTLLGTVAGATITFAGIAFSISLLVIQLASSQHSPRVVDALFRDPFNRRVMAVVLGTFTYCLVVLRSVRSGLPEGADPVIPNVSVAVAVLLGIVSVLAVVALMDHNAKAMDVGRLLQRVTVAALGPVPPVTRDAGGVGSSAAAHRLAARGAGQEVVRFERHGWVQQVDFDALCDIPPGEATIVLETHPGRFAVPGAVLAWVDADRPAAVDHDAIRAAVTIGDSRTMQQDRSYALRQLVDVALRALSPGVNDPTTAQEAIYHSAVVLAHLLEAPEPPTALERSGGGMLVLSAAPAAADLVGFAFDEVRRAASSHPAVATYLFEAIGLVGQAAPSAPRRAHDALAEQARLLLELVESAGLAEADLVKVRAAYDERFAAASPGEALG